MTWAQVFVVVVKADDTAGDWRAPLIPLIDGANVADEGRANGDGGARRLRPKPCTPAPRVNGDDGAPMGRLAKGEHVEPADNGGEKGDARSALRC